MFIVGEAFRLPGDGFPVPYKRSSIMVPSIRYSS